MLQRVDVFSLFLHFSVLYPHRGLFSLLILCLQRVDHARDLAGALLLAELPYVQCPTGLG